MNRTFIILLGLAVFLGAGFGGSFIGGVIYGQTLEDDASELSPRLGAAGQFPGGGAGAAAGQRGQGGAGAGAAAGQRGQGFAGARGGGNLSAQQTSTEGTSPEGAQQASQPDSRQAGQRGNGAGRRSQSEASAGRVQSESVADTEETGPQAAQGPANAEQGGTTTGAPARGGLVGTVGSLEGDTLTVISAMGEQTALLVDSTTVYEITEASRDSLTSETAIRIIGSRNQEGYLTAQSVIIMPVGTEDLFGAAGGPGGRRRGGGP